MNKEIDKKIAELMSRYGRPWSEPVYSKYRLVEEFCLFVSRWKYRLTEGLYFKIKYFLQRHIRGYDDLDKWNAAWYIARKAVPVLTAWRNGKMMGTAIRRHIESRHGEIIELSERGVDVEEAFTEEQWKAIIDDIIFAFNYVLNDDAVCSELPVSPETQDLLQKRYKRGMRLLGIYFSCLWD